jgi:hypothetical protein
MIVTGDTVGTEVAIEIMAIADMADGGREEVVPGATVCFFVDTGREELKGARTL